MKNFYSIKNAFIAVAVAVIGLAMASCNGKVSEIQKTIPADVDVVCALNVANILDNADCKATSEGILSFHLYWPSILMHWPEKVLWRCSQKSKE